MNATRKNVIRFERDFRDFIRPLLGNPLVENGVIVLILLSLIAAAGSIFSPAPWVNRAHWFFTVLFSLELSLRYFTYDRKQKRDYLQDWWIDWVATIPWDILLFFFFPGGSAAAARILRIPRIMRLLRFRKKHQSWLYQSLAYRFKRLLEGSIFGQMLVLAVGSLIVVAGFAFMLDKIDAKFEIGDNFWFSLISVISTDCLFEMQTQPTAVRALIFLLTLIGAVVFNGILIAIIVGKLMSHLTEIKKGHGNVREKGHILLLGESEYIPHILNELEVYCQTERKRQMKVVVMKEQADEITEQALFSFRPNVEMIQRVGNASNPNALERISILKARGVVVFGGYGKNRWNVVLNDALVNKTLLSIRCLLNRSHEENLDIQPVLTYLSEKSYARECLLHPNDDSSGNTKKKLQPVEFCPGLFTANLIACMCANPYAYEIYSELLTAAGNEFHILKKYQCPEGKDLQFGNLLNRFTKAIPVGFFYITDKGEREFRLVLEREKVIPSGAELLVLAPNSGAARKTAKPSPASPAQLLNHHLPDSDSGHGQRVVIIGVNNKLPAMIRELEKLKRQILVVDNQGHDQFEEWCSGQEISKVDFKECHFLKEQEIKDVLAEDLTKAAQVIILADGHLLGDASPDEIDAETLSRLLTIRNFLRDNSNPHLVVEILTSDSEEVIKEIHESCFHVVGPLFIGRMLTTFTLYPELAPVFKTLIETGEVDIRVAPVAEEWKNQTFADLLNNPPANAIPIGMIGKDGTLCLNPPRNKNSEKDKKLSEAKKIVYLVRSK